MFRGMGFQGVHIGGFALKTQDFRFIVERAAAIAPHWEEFVPEVSFSRDGEFYAFPPPPSYRPAPPDADPVPSFGRGRRSLKYTFARGMHRAVFDRRGLGCRLMTRYYRAIGERSIMARASHFAEYLLKFLTFDCRDCGDCALPDMAYCCPQGKCAKQQRNGPCGGSRDGMCEVFPDDRRCVWTIVYDRLKHVGRLDELRGRYTPPRKTELQYTSAWANYYLGRDHGAGATTPALGTEPKGPTA